MHCINSVIECTITRKISSWYSSGFFIKPSDGPIPQPTPLTMQLRVQNLEFKHCGFKPSFIVIIHMIAVKSPKTLAFSRERLPEDHCTAWVWQSDDQLFDWLSWQ